MYSHVIMMYIGGLCMYIIYVCIGVCTNLWKLLEMKEVTNCSTYNYTKIETLMNEVWHASYIQF